MIKAIHSEKAPAALGPYSQAIQTNQLLFLSGQIGLDPVTLTLIAGGFASELHQIFSNLDTVIRAAGAKMSQIVKLTIYLQDLNDFSTLNEIMKDYLQPPFPARTTIEVASLPKGAKVELDAIVAV